MKGSLPMEVSSLVLVQTVEFNFTMANLENLLIRLATVSTKAVYSLYPGPKILKGLSRRALIKLSSFGTWRQEKQFRPGNLEGKAMSVFRIIRLVLFGLPEEVMGWLQA